MKKCKKCGKKLNKNNTTGYCVKCKKLLVYKCIEPNCDNKVSGPNKKCQTCYGISLRKPKKIYYCIELDCKKTVSEPNRRCPHHASIKKYSDPKEREKISKRQKGINNNNYKHGNNCKGKIHYCIEKDCEEKVSGPDKRCKKCGYVVASLKRTKPKLPKPIYHCIEPDCNKEVSEPDRRCCSHAMILRFSNPEERKKVRLGCKKRWSNPEERKKIGEISKKRWLDIDFRNRAIKKWMKSCAIKPNKKEILLQKILNNLFPKEYKYVGDGKVILDGFNPDFININGQKKIIEMFGDYWHKRKEVIKRDKKRLKAYKELGYETLIIWEHELGKKRTVNRILKFNEVMQ